MTQATPRPWAAINSITQATPSPWKAAGSQTLVTSDGTFVQAGSKPVRDEILRAVNHHDELVKAVKLAEDTFVTFLAEGGITVEMDLKKHIEKSILPIIRAPLARIERDNA